MFWKNDPNKNALRGRRTISGIGEQGWKQKYEKLRRPAADTPK
jgi:hypothetical protein